MRGGRLAGLLLLVAVLAGCGGLASDGPVQEGLEVGSNEAPALTIVFPGPEPDAPQESIVRGFLRAGAASGGAYDNARRFLTGAVAEQWNPDQTLQLLATASAPTVRATGADTVEVSSEAAGTVDANGRYTAHPPGTTVRAEFRLVSVDGQWRIDRIPEGFGRWLASNDVGRLVQPYAVNYVSTSLRSTVEDVRWFPVDKLATRLARAQLLPVPAHLEGAAVTAVPDGARLLGDAVSVENGVASVNLISTPIAPGEATRQNLWAQFVSTLTQDPTVMAVRLAVDGVPVDVDGVEGPVSSLTRVGFPAPEPDTSLAKPVVRRGATVSVFDPRLGSQADTRGSEAPRAFPDIPQGYTRLAESADGSEVAAVDPGGGALSRWRDGIRYEVPGLGGLLGAPAYDRRGFLWVGSVSVSGRLFVVDVRATPGDPVAAEARAVTASWLSDRRVLQARVSDGGDRVVVVSSAGDGRDVRVDLAGVVRGQGEQPERLSPPLQLGVDVGSAAGLTWTDDRTVATLAEVAGQVAPTLFGVGGDVTRLTPIDGATSVASVDGTLYAVASGRLWLRSGARWVDAGEGTDLATPAG